MFPIQDNRGNVIGFGGRLLGDGEPKYLNSPETPLFEKGPELYGLFLARLAIRDSQTAIVVEGSMDVVALAQHGVENAVATLGTSTTPMHVETLLRMADNLVFCFDGDNAGQKAAWRVLEQSLPAVFQDGKDIRFMFLPPEDDPDTFVRRLGKAAFLAEAANAKPLTHAYIGTGAILRQGKPDKPLVIGRGAVVGMGAVVTKDVPPGVTVIGKPARPLVKD